MYNCIISLNSKDDKNNLFLALFSILESGAKFSKLPCFLEDFFSKESMRIFQTSLLTSLEEIRQICRKALTLSYMEKAVFKNEICKSMQC